MQREGPRRGRRPARGLVLSLASLPPLLPGGEGPRCRSHGQDPRPHALAECRRLSLCLVVVMPPFLPIQRAPEERAHPRPHLGEHDVLVRPERRRRLEVCPLCLGSGCCRGAELVGASAGARPVESTHGNEDEVQLAHVRGLQICGDRGELVEHCMCSLGVPRKMAERPSRGVWVAPPQRLETQSRPKSAVASVVRPAGVALVRVGLGAAAVAQQAARFPGAPGVSDHGMPLAKPRPQHVARCCCPLPLRGIAGPWHHTVDLG
mmetsp:Transcript_158925/g.509802  ORF Transcript_158925/g.509802 Transcript_158925/m.509802 type:complete len:263 (+) Transcript_158925:1497-2285(+)